MNFIKYNSIDNVSNKTILHYREKLIGPFCVTEKIHGSNFQVTCDWNTLEYNFGKRSSFISENSNFYNWQTILEKYDFKTILKRAKEELDLTDKVIDKALIQYGIVPPKSQIKSFTIFGELCGGSYPTNGFVEKDIELNYKPTYRAIQKGVFYANNVEFVVFDLRLNYEDKVSYIRHDYLKKIIKELPIVPIDFIGTFDKCLDYSKKHYADNSKIFKLFNLPEVPVNIREGNVIKPLKNIDYSLNESRLIFKDKNDKFAENSGKEKPIKEVFIINEDFVKELDKLICTNRFNNVTSKFGEYSIRDFNTLLNLFFEDIKEEIDIEKYLEKFVKGRIARFFSENKNYLF